ADAVLRHESQGPPTPPPMPKFYTVSGTIELPYAEISEPFSAYVDNEKQLSRIDYYSGMVQSFNFANASHSGYLLHPVSTETEKNKRDCYQLAGVYNVQNVLPDASYFTYSRAEEVRGVMCNVFVNKTVFADKVNTYTLWVGQKDNRPYRYDMIGYDSLLGSHYDRYYVEYMEYDDKTRPQAKDFEVKAPNTCHPAPPSDGVAALNPLSELVSGGDHRSVDAHFQRFQTVHRRFKPYDSQVEERRRTHAFRQNLRYIHSKNRAGLPYKLAVNHLATSPGTSSALDRVVARAAAAYWNLPAGQLDIRLLCPALETVCRTTGTGESWAACRQSKTRESAARAGRSALPECWRAPILLKLENESASLSSSWLTAPGDSATTAATVVKTFRPTPTCRSTAWRLRRTTGLTLCRTRTATQRR
ncbi:hypothetical protein BOX15_Mlig029086g2, partial [Macrostomum lignano]